MLTKETVGEYVTVTPSGILEYKLVERILDDGVEIATKNWRTTYNPSQPLDDLPARCRAIAEAVWTQDVIDAYAASL